MNRLIQNIQQTLSELNDVLGQLDTTQFSRSLPIFSGSSIGMHARHIIEFYQCLLSQSFDNQSINYDRRSRDLLLQNDINYFSEVSENIISTLDTLSEKQLKSSIHIATDDTDETMTSSLDRELQYNLEHTIHHAALIKIGILNLMPHTTLPASFGVAPSTMRHREKKLILQ